MPDTGGCRKRCCRGRLVELVTGPCLRARFHRGLDNPAQEPR